ncbi:MAG TPA: hypothetical protein PLD27_09930 [bacterium]|nr:hypothetical protein [bacterium]HOL48762.1 hypothetical protein [bacterium]HPQ19560.1 hypothetical protein [bacterium]
MTKNKIITYLLIIIFLLAISFWYNFLYKSYKINQENYQKSKAEILAKINEIKEKIKEIKKVEKEDKYSEIKNKKIVKDNIDLGDCLNKIIGLFKANNVNVLELTQSDNKVKIKFSTSYNNFYRVIYNIIDNEYVINIEEFKITAKEQNSSIIEGYIILSIVLYVK